MQKFGNTIITDQGLELLTSVNAGDDKITYTQTVLAADDLTQVSDEAIRAMTALQNIKMSISTNVDNRINDTVNLSASFINSKITEDFDFYCIGWYARGSSVIKNERLFAITPSTVKQTMPASQNGAATASITPKYASTLSRSADVTINPEPAGSVTADYVQQQIANIQGLINSGSILSTNDDLDQMLTTTYNLIKGSVPQHAPSGLSNYGQAIIYGNKDTTDGITQLVYDDVNRKQFVRYYDPVGNVWSVWDQITTQAQLADSLPTDIARTGVDNAFTGKNSFKVDPVNATGSPYGLAKDIATKVADNNNGTITVNGKTYTPATIDQLNPQLVTVTDVNTLTGLNGQPWIVAFAGTTNLPDGANSYYVRTINAGGGYMVQQTVTEAIPDTIYQRTYQGDHWSNWHTINTDNSKVVHNTGDEEIAGTKTFDTAPIDKTTGNPYITKDGVPAVPSTLADTTKLANFTGGLQKGGIDVATAADLKSVEASAWRQLDSKYITTQYGNASSAFVYRIGDGYLAFFLSTNRVGGIDSVSVDLSSIITGIKSVDAAFITSTNFQISPTFDGSTMLLDLSGSNSDKVATASTILSLPKITYTGLQPGA